MTNFILNHILKPQLTDEGVSVSELLELLNQKDELTELLLDALNIEDFEQDFIKIKGAKKLVETQKSINARFHKEDLISSLDDISIDNEDKLRIQFNNLEENEYFSQLGISLLDTTPKYSSKSDFFSWLYGMDKYASKLMKNGLTDILLSNIELLKQHDISKDKRKYRILHDLWNNEFYLRAIISLDRYNNYDNNITIVIALLTLHRKMKEQSIQYAINRVEYNESCVRIFVEQIDKRYLKNIGSVKDIIEISNDEVKRESLKFEAVSNIEFIDSEKNLQEIIIQPSGSRPKIKTNILAITHSTSPVKVVEKLGELDTSIEIHDKLFSLIEEIAQIENPLQIIHLVRRKVDAARNEEFKKHKSSIQKMLERHTVTNMIQLLTLFKKMELITENDIEASEYIRYIIYQSLIERK